MVAEIARPQAGFETRSQIGWSLAIEVSPIQVFICTQAGAANIEAAVRGHELDGRQVAPPDEVCGRVPGAGIWRAHRHLHAATAHAAHQGVTGKHVVTFISHNV